MRIHRWFAGNQSEFEEEGKLKAFDSVQKRISFIGVGVLLAGSVVAIGATGTSAHEGVGHPAHVHAGSCPAPGDVLFPLSDVSGENLVDGESMAGDTVGSANAVPVDVSVTTVEASLADLAGSEHAIVVHESAENIGNYVLCGDIGGTMLGESDLPIGLGELNDSGASGSAWLHDNGDGTTEIRIVVTMSEEEHAHDEGDAAGEEVAVSIESFSFGDPIEVTVGTTVTWTNNDSAPHTVTQKGGEGFQSNQIASGDTFSFTFTEAGTFEYFCEFHANMSGTVIVTG